MTKLTIDEARTWATGHLLAAGAICGLIGLVIGAVLF